MTVRRFLLWRKEHLLFGRMKAVYAIILCMVCVLLLDYRFPSIDSMAHYESNSVPDKNIVVIGKSSLDLSSHRKRTFLGFEDTDINKRLNISQSDSTSGFRFASKLTLVIVVCSHPEHVQLRQTIRATWGSDINESDGVTVVFLLGQSADQTWRDLIKREMTIHGDIVSVNVTENYGNLARKVISGMDWIVRNVPRFRYYMKCDDDVYINVPYLLSELRRGVINDMQILGAVCADSRVIRDGRDEWSVPYEVYPAEIFPTYVAGGGYVIPNHALRLLLTSLTDNVQIHLEDVLVTGVLARRAGLTHVGHPGFSFWSSPKAKPCDIVSSRKIVSVNMSPKRILTLHSQINKILAYSRNICTNSNV